MTGAVESIGNVLLGKSAVLNTTSTNHCLDELVLRVRSGDVDAFDDIMIETESRVLGLAWRILGNKEQAKDASQEAFLRAFKSISSYRIGESFPAWIGRITANVCIDYMKKRENGYSSSEILEQLPAPDSDCTDELLHQQHRELLQKALVTLTPAERSALVLRDMEGLSTDEVARVLGLKAGTVRTQISQARIKLKNFCRRVLHRNKGDRQ